MKFTVGGRPLSLTAHQVTEAMSGVEPEQYREHVVLVGGEVFPPKQVLAAVTNWPRQSFTTMEAQRVLTKLGFQCRRVGERDGHKDWVAPTAADLDANDPEESIERRFLVLENGLATAQAAIAGLHARLTLVESGA